MEQLQAMSDKMPAFMIGGMIILIIAAVLVVLYRASGQSSQWDVQEKEFEQSMVSQFGAGGSKVGASAMPVMPPTLPIGSTEAFVQPMTAPAKPTGAFDHLPEFARSVAARLNAAGIVQSSDGPLRTRNPEIVGTILCMRGNKKVAVIESGWKTPDPDLEMTLSLLDGVVIPGPGEEPIFVRKLQSFIGDSIRL